ARIEHGLLVADPVRDILKVAVIERHRPKSPPDPSPLRKPGADSRSSSPPPPAPAKGSDHSGSIGLGFVKGLRFSRGALASTVGHDAPTLAVVGASDGDMLVAARAVADAGGGQCVVLDGKVLALLPLPIAGLMSDQPAETVIREQAALLGA